VPGDYFYDMVEYSGAYNIFGDAKNVQVNPEAVIERNPAYIVKVSEPKVNSSYIPPTAEDHARILSELKSREGWDTIDAVKNDRILLLSHYVHGGASKLVGTMYIAKFLYPDQLPDLHPEDVFKVWLEKYQHLPYVAGHTLPAFPLSGEEH
jgi:iron(III) dicitrate-binding protein